jgi:hypothetical protein
MSRASLSRGAAWALMLCALVPAAAGCVRRAPFTHEMREKYNLSDEDLKQVPFYLSDTIALRRVTGGREAQVVKGRSLRLVESATVEEVRIRHRTPGLAEQAGKYSMQVSFEEGQSLTFGTTEDEVKRPDGDGRYFLFAEWNGAVGRLKYGGKEYETRAGAGGVFLMVEMRELETRVTKSRTAPGRMRHEKKAEGTAE